MLLYLIDVGFCEQEPPEESIFGSCSCGREGRTSLSCTCSGLCCVPQWWDTSRCQLQHHKASSSLKVKNFILLYVVFGKLRCELLWLGKVWEPVLQSCQVCATAPDQSCLSIHERELVVSWNWPSQQQFSLVSLGLVMFIRMCSVESSSSAYRDWIQLLPARAPSSPEGKARHSILAFEDWKEEGEAWKMALSLFPWPLKSSLLIFSLFVYLLTYVWQNFLALKVDNLKRMTTHLVLFAFYFPCEL